MTLDEMIDSAFAFHRKYPNSQSPVITVGSIEIFAEAIRQYPGSVFPAEPGGSTISSLYGISVVEDTGLARNEMRVTDKDGNTQVSILKTVESLTSSCG